MHDSLNKLLWLWVLRFWERESVNNGDVFVVIHSDDVWSSSVFAPLNQY